MNDLIEKENIENMIYEIRGKQVMLDSDLAKLYQCTNGTKDINKAVNRNIEKFPNDFYFRLTEKEVNSISRFQTGTLNGRGSNIKYLPHVFTEQGVAMLATILHTKVATQVSINIMRAFVEMRHYLNDNQDIYKSINHINNKLVEHDEKFDLLFSSFKEKNNHLFFNGEIYDAYSLMIDIFNKSQEEIIIIDNYLDKNLLDILSKTNKNVKVVTNKYIMYDYSQYIEQYHHVELIINNNFHDRFIIIDRKILYHSGASFKDLGIKCFGINRIEDKKYLSMLLEEISIYE